MSVKVKTVQSFNKYIQYNTKEEEISTEQASELNRLQARLLVRGPFSFDFIGGIRQITFLKEMRKANSFISQIFSVK